MQKKRFVDPSFWSDERVVECSAYARLLFIGALNHSDDHGILPRNAKRLKMQVFPAEDLTAEQVDELIDELTRCGLLLEYHVEGVKYLSYRTFDKYQSPRHKQFLYPTPDLNDDSCNQNQGYSDRLTPVSVTENGVDDPVEPSDLRQKTANAPQRRGEDRGGEDRSGENIVVASATTRSTATPPTRSRYSATFEEFWDAYPRHSAKGRAAKAFDRHVKLVGTERELMRSEAVAWLVEAAGEYAASSLVRSLDDDKVPHAATWLNDRRYDDDRGEWNQARAGPNSGKQRQGGGFLETLAKRAAARTDE